PRVAAARSAAVLVFVSWAGVGAAAGVYPGREQGIVLIYRLLHPRRLFRLTALGDEYIYRRSPSGDAPDVLCVFETRFPSPGRAGNGLHDSRLTGRGRRRRR
ncbi:hypothetical protein BD626DRAFT_482685, partial [Schizophyllum amplum]